VCVAQGHSQLNNLHLILSVLLPLLSYWASRIYVLFCMCSACQLCPLDHLWAPALPHGRLQQVQRPAPGLAVLAAQAKQQQLMKPRSSSSTACWMGRGTDTQKILSATATWHDRTMGKINVGNVD
jgi:hypothetical protein